MSQCYNCGKTMLFGGQTIDGHRYCGTNCARSHSIHKAAANVPADVLQKYVTHWRNGPCPRCKKQNGPVDTHAHHRVHSFILMTQWRTQRSVSCRRCGRRAQMGSALYSAVLGWWGFPWGLVVTPVQVARNIAEICRRDQGRPTPEFERLVRLHLAKQQIQAQRAQIMPPKPGV
jgi:hypothetical protein